MTRNHLAFGQAFGTRRADMVGTHCLDDRGAHEAGDDRNLWQGQRDYGQGHIVPVHPDIRIGSETANREDAGTKGKDQDQDRAGNKSGDRNACHGDPHDAVIRRRILSESRKNTQQCAHRYAQTHGEKPDGEGDGQAVCNQVVHALAKRFVGRSEIAGDNAANIAQILFVKRFVETELGCNGSFGRRRQFPLTIERTTRSGAHHQESHRYDGKHCGDCN